MKKKWEMRETIQKIMRKISSYTFFKNEENIFFGYYITYTKKNIHYAINPKDWRWMKDGV